MSPVVKSNTFKSSRHIDFSKHTNEILEHPDPPKKKIPKHIGVLVKSESVDEVDR